MNKFSDFNVSVDLPMSGEKIKISKILNRKIIVNDYRLNDSKYSKNKSGQCLTLQIVFEGVKRVVFTGSDVLIRQITQVNRDCLPFECEIMQEGDHYEFK